MSDQRSRPSPILMLAPTALILLGYNYLFHFPEQRDLTKVNQQLEKLVKNRDEIQHQRGHVLQDLSKARQQERAERQSLEQHQAEVQEALRRQQQLRQSLMVQSPPARTIDAAFQLFQRHGMTVVESGSANHQRGALPEELRKTLELIKEPGTAKPETTIHRGVYRVQLVGSFEDLQRAVDALATSLEDVILLDVQLQAVEFGSIRRQWTLTLLV